MKTTKARIIAVIAVILGCVMIFGSTAAFAAADADAKEIAADADTAANEIAADADAAANEIAADADAAAKEVATDGSPFHVTAPTGVVSFHTQLQQDALEAGAEHIYEFSNNGQEELSIPEGIWFTWTYEDPQPDHFVLSLATQEDMSDAVTFEIPRGTGEYQFNVQNLLLGTDYYYTIAADDNVSEVYTFSTSDQGPRNLYVDGVTNIRDLGGWTTNDGRKIRQGLLFRCGELNAAGTQDPCITQDGIDVMRDALNVKTEIDLRRTDNDETGNITESFLGSDVSYYSNPIGVIKDVSPDEEAIAETFRIIADKDSYPIIYHCKIGTDRTGLVSYLILALCDVNMEDIYTDYAFSNLGHIEGKRNIDRLDKMIEDNMADLAGETPHETAVNYLHSIGLTDEELDSIVSILVE